MKWLIGALAAALFWGSPSQARAQNVVEMAFESKPRECAWYRGSFDALGISGPMTDALPKVACRLVDQLGSRCVVTEHGLPGRGPLELRGIFVADSVALVVKADDGVLFNFRLICDLAKGPNNSCLFQLWNVNNLIGYSCNLKVSGTKVPTPKKSPPKAPPSKIEKGELST